MTEPWLTKRELARELQVSVRTIERLRVPAMRVGGQNRYRLTEAEDFMRSTLLRGEQSAGNVIQFPSRKVPA